MYEQFNYNEFFSNFPILELEAIKLRELMYKDQENYYKLMSDPEVNRYLSDEDVPESVEDAIYEIKYWSGLFYKKHSIFWALTDSATDNLIGTVGFNSWSFNNQRAEISYDLMHELWRKGIMTKALTAVLQFAFQQMDLNRIEARTMLNNTASQNLLCKLGFQKEGVLRNYRKIRGQFIDVVLFSLVRQDYLSTK